jgi:hypothetical protein
MPSIIQKRLEIPILVALGLWGLMSSIQGAGLSLFVSGPNQYTDTSFIELVYFSVITGVLMSLISARLASLLLGLAAITAVIMLYRTDGFGHSLVTAKPLLLAIVLRPVLAGLVLLALPSRGPFLREFSARRARNLGGPS